ncbi:MAG: tRNA threonylcarbamoyladenosine biosynthesis protein TsaB [Enterobacterales bacterium]|jgi:tRNA threonylcarbamoyladenosine biosynthesis protein TsaB
MSKSMSLSILAIETCSETCSVAVSHNDITHQLISTVPRGHADNILPLIDKIMDKAGLQLSDLDVIGFSRGPGAFTGVRIGTAVAQGLSLASKLPLVAVSSLAVLAQTSYRVTGIKHCIPALDARMSEVYLGFYQLNDKGCMVAEQDDQVAAAESVNCEKEQQYLEGAHVWQGYGPGWTNYPEQINKRFADWSVEVPKTLVYPEAIDLLALAELEYQEGRLLDPAEAIPVYVRDQVVRS